MFFFTFYLQTVRGLTPLAAGLWSVPFAVSQLVFGPLSARMVRRFGARAVAGTGLLGVAAAFLAYRSLTLASPIWGYGLVAFVQGSFAANVTPAATTVVMTSVPRERAGVASSVTNTVRQVGGALGVAALGTVLTSSYRHRARPLLDAVPLPTSARREAAESIQATHAAAGVPGSVVRAADGAFVHALHVATSTTAVVMAAAAFAILVLTPRRGDATLPSE
jgi:MFS family permease